MEISYDLDPHRITTQKSYRENLPFGVEHSGHMFLMDFKEGGWQDPRVVTYGPLSLMPNAAVLHYAQEIFEGAKAFQHPDGELYTFRLEENVQRMNESAEVMRMPEIDPKDQKEAIHALLDVDRLWYPNQEGASLYIRPFMFATEPFLGVRPAKEFTYCVILSPSGPYYSTGALSPIKLWATDRYKRAIPDGLIVPKAGALYGLSLYSKEMAKIRGADQVLYLSADGKQVDEAGSMNNYHVRKTGEIVLPPASDTILKGITTDTFELLGESHPKLKGRIVREEVKVDHYIRDLLRGDIVEAGGLGTAAAVSSVGNYIVEDSIINLRNRLRFARQIIRNRAESGDVRIQVGNGLVGEVTKAMYEALTGIQYGRSKFGIDNDWLELVKRR